MALYKRRKTWWINIIHHGQHIQRSTGTKDKIAAEQYHDKIKAALWAQDKLKEKPKRTWKEAVVKWFSEMQHKRSLKDDQLHVRWLNPYLGNLYLTDITKEVLESVAQAKENLNVQPATVNRMLAVIRSILRKAANEWEWIEHVPKVRMRREDNKRVRWLSKTEATQLVNVLPPHLSAMAAFSLSTGLRQANVTGLMWENVNMVKRHALIHPDQAKGKKAIPVPLNEDAINILKNQQGHHPLYVFTFKGNRIKQVSTKAWRKALRKIGIYNFRWHDLRHTWASWHIQNGTTLQELQILGGWSSFDMVLRYAHLSSDHLQVAAERISLQEPKKVNSLEIGSSRNPVTNLLH